MLSRTIRVWPPKLGTIHVTISDQDDAGPWIRREFPEHFIGTAFFDEMARIYSASRVVFNRSLRNDVNMRVFEALACGSMLATNDLADNGQAELFRDRGHLATYRDPGEMLEIIAGVEDVRCSEPSLLGGADDQLASERSVARELVGVRVDPPTDDPRTVRHRLTAGAQPAR